MMFSTIRKRLTYANLAATLALVFAMTGGAYAANRYLINTTKQINPKVLKQLKGANGKNGLAGPAGTAGAAGPTGAAGPGGPQGAGGSAGVKGETGPAGPQGPKGTTGAEGKEGALGTAGTTLPAGASEHGEWTIFQHTSGESGELVGTSVSFPIPLAGPLDEEHSRYIGPEEGEGELKEDKNAIPAHCKGTFAKPEAVSGNLCVFAKGVIDHATFEPLTTLTFQVSNAETGGGTGPSGGYIATEAPSALKTEIFALGSWVVTG